MGPILCLLTTFALVTFRIATPTFINLQRSYQHTATKCLKRIMTVPVLSPPSSDTSQNSDEVYDFDYLVIGAGSGGLASASRATSYGAKTAIVENNRLGGTCVNIGCVPKKVMFNAASIAETIQNMKHYGFNTDECSFTWSVLKKNRDKYIARLNTIYENNIHNSNITLLEGTASFTENAKRVIVKNSKKNSIRQIHARHVLIATGGYPIFPEGPGIKEHSISSDGFFTLESLPSKTVIVGAGYIAVELAGILHALGSETSLVLRNVKVLRSFDESLSYTLEKEMLQQGINIYRNTKGLARIELDSQGKKTVYLHNGNVFSNVDCVIVATGRSPMVEYLNLPPNIFQRQNRSQGHKKKLQESYIHTNEYSETAFPNIYALGDVVGNVELTPMAIATGRRLADRLFGGPSFRNAKVSYDTVPTVVFSHPPIGTIGLTEQQAVQKYGFSSIKVYKSKFTNMYYGIWTLLENDTKPQTLMKLICMGPNEQVVGLHVIGMGADEMLQGFGIALKMGATKADFDSCIAIHPTASEEFVTMYPWGLSPQVSGAKVSPLDNAITESKF